MRNQSAAPQHDVRADRGLTKHERGIQKSDPFFFGNAHFVSRAKKKEVQGSTSTLAAHITSAASQEGRTRGDRYSLEAHSAGVYRMIREGQILAAERQ